MKLDFIVTSIKRQIPWILKRLHFKQLILASFIVLLLLNYFVGWRYEIMLGENMLYRYSFYLLLVLWILVVWQLKKKITYWFKIGFLTFFFAVIFLLIDKKLVAEILLSYSLIIFFTATILSVVKLRRSDEN